MEKEITIKCENVIKELGLEILSDEEKAKIIQEMTDLVCDKIMLKLVDRISDDEIDEANEIMSGENEDEKIKLLEDKMPDFSQLLEEEIKMIKENIVDNKN
jgi:hypothetical protein